MLALSAIKCDKRSFLFSKLLYGRPQRATGLPSPQSLQAPNIQSNLLRASRLRVRLSFREASGMSRRIASTLSDQIYFAAPSTLSDYETRSAPPRHIQKIITLCVVYCIGFREFARACGVPVDQDGHEPIADELVPRTAAVPYSQTGL